MRAGLALLTKGAGVLIDFEIILPNRIAASQGQVVQNRKDAL